MKLVGGMNNQPNYQGRLDKSKRPTYQQGVALTGMSTVISIASLFIETLIAARLLDTNSFGIFQIIVVVVNLIVMVVDLGWKTTVTQMLASSERSRQELIVSTGLLFRTAVIFAVSIIVLLAQDLLLIFDSSGEILHYAALIPIMVLVTSGEEFFLAIHQGLQGFHHMAVSQIMRGALRLALSAGFLLFLKTGMPGLIYSWIISFGASLLLLFFVLPLPKRLILSSAMLKEMFNFGLPLYGNRVLFFVSGRIDVLLLGAMIGPNAVAYYNVATRIPTGLLQLEGSYTSVFFPTMTDYLANGKKVEATRLLNRSIRFLAFVFCFTALIGVLFGGRIITLLFSEKYAPSSGIFSILMTSLPLVILANIMGYSLTSAGFPARSLAQNTVGVIVTITANLVLIPLLGITGPAYASFLGYLVTSLLCVWLLWRSGVNFAASNVLKPVAFLLFFIGLVVWPYPIITWYKFVAIFSFLLLNQVLSMISVDDLGIVVPERMLQRLFIPRKDFTNGN